MWRKRNPFALLVGIQTGASTGEDSMDIFQKVKNRGSWVAQSVKHPTLDFSSGHDLTVCDFKSHVMLCTNGVEPASDPLSPSLLSAPSLPFFLSLKNK